MRGMQIKMRSLYTNQIGKLEHWIMLRAVKDMQKQDPLRTAGQECKVLQPFGRVIWWYWWNLFVCVLWPSNSTPATIMRNPGPGPTRAHVWRCSRWHHLWGQKVGSPSRSLTSGKCINKIWWVHTIDSCAIVRSKELNVHGAAWIKLEKSTELRNKTHDP